MSRGRRTLPIFPLPAVVLLPETLLPLHVFEPRYRELLADALAGERLIGVQTLRPGEPPEERDTPPVLAVGCAGSIVEHEPLEDGRSNVLLRGTFRYRIETERRVKAYRVAEVEILPVEPLPASSTAGRRELRRQLSDLIERLAISVRRPEARRLPRGLSDEGLVNTAADRLGLGSEARYQLLEMDRLEDRYAWVLAHVAGLQRRLDLLEPFRRDGSDPRWN